MGIAIYPGSFDPITFGHIDIALRASKIFSKVITVVAENLNKTPLFSLPERVEMVKEALKEIPNIEVVSHKGLIIECLKRYNANVIIRGLRAISDLEYEFQMAYTNRKLYEGAETIFLMPSARYTYLNSRMVKQIASLGGDIHHFVPDFVGKLVYEKVNNKK
ncbi:MAG: pantetheine-phosphate adenylyltransferase [Chitinispirillaceae bacterium]|nr:pantetheine-phosphate adenylyltransferase [Chitinispirillaceae bacterium]